MLAQYRAGSGVDAVGGVEAIISHLITKHLRLPCAHAPALEPLGLEPHLSPRACAEELGHTFLPCVLNNLARAPSLIDGDDAPKPGDLWHDDIDAIVAPAGALGGAATMALLGTGSTLVIGVEENACALDVSAARLQGEAGGADGAADAAGSRPSGVVVVRSYMEALGLLAAHKAGVNPACLTADVASIRDLGIGGGGSTEDVAMMDVVGNTEGVAAAAAEPAGAGA